jgi:hypothetical protein
MKRRGFFGAVAAAVGMIPVVGLKAKPVEPQPHYYRWSFHPFTTDPRFNGFPPYGEGVKVICNGMSLDKVTRCETGPNGWAEIYACDESGNIILNDAKDGGLRLMLNGDVRFEFDEEANKRHMNDEN